MNRWGNISEDSGNEQSLTRAKPNANSRWLEPWNSWRGLDHMKFIMKSLFGEY